MTLLSQKTMDDIQARNDQRLAERRQLAIDAVVWETKDFIDNNRHGSFTLAFKAGTLLFIKREETKKVEE